MDQRKKNPINNLYITGKKTIPIYIHVCDQCIGCWTHKHHNQQQQQQQRRQLYITYTHSVLVLKKGSSL
ncbi:hypothetical protein DERF_007370 [Dermatophagoides farinae]|uniref:Uncharacterized protein n=1 Tax=Dermatophagoides farinae TaxID=6954 RepID=A0A922L4E9_DERFA|nr:hypothetical protein DERF_007370 [Dermatophagoides farinae]